VVINNLAAKKQVDLILMGTVCRTAMTDFFIGNSVENFLQQVVYSMLTVKPEGFVSPFLLEER
jgi:universal stress protein E